MTPVKLSVILIQNLPEEERPCCRLMLESATAGLDVEIIQTDRFTGTEDEIIGQTHGEYILCMETRVLPGEDILRTACFFLDEHPEAGMVGVQLIDGHGNQLPESQLTFPSSWKKILHKSGLSKQAANKSLPFYLFRRETWEKVKESKTIYQDYSFDLRLADRMRTNNYTNYSLPEQVLFLKEEQSSVKQKHRRMLIIGYEKELETAKNKILSQLPVFEFINFWDLNENRIMEAICRKNRMKSFTDMTFIYPDVRMEQILLFLEQMPEKTLTYHIYHTDTNTLITTVR